MNYNQKLMVVKYGNILLITCLLLLIQLFFYFFKKELIAKRYFCIRHCEQSEAISWKIFVRLLRHFVSRNDVPYDQKN